MDNNLQMTSQATKDCVTKTLKRLEEKIHGRVSIVMLITMFL